MARNFAVIRMLCSELYFVKTGDRKQKEKNIIKLQYFWVKFMGFNSILEMTEEDIRSLERILISRINGERKRLGLPGISQWFQL